MKTTTLFLILLVLIVPLVIGAGGDYMDYVTVGLGDSRWCNVFNGCNYTGNVYAQDWLLWNGSSCCLGGASGVSSVTGTSPIVSSGGSTPDISWSPVNIALGWGNITNIPELGNTTAEIRSLFGNSSNITYDESTGSFYYNGSIGEGGAMVNHTDINHTRGYFNWLTIYAPAGLICTECILPEALYLMYFGLSDFTDDVGFQLQEGAWNNLNFSEAMSGYTNITYYNDRLNSTINASIDLRVDDSFLQNLLDTIYASISYVDTRVDSIINTTDSVIQGWINSNSTADRAYTDTRVDSINNLSNSSILDLTSVYNDTENILWENSTGVVRLKVSQDVNMQDGDISIRDSDNEFHNISRILQITDEMNRNVTLTGLNGTLASDGNLTITTKTGNNIIVNIDKSESILNRNIDSIIITSGTNESPILNQMVYTNAANPVLSKRTTLGLKAPSVSAFLQGANFTYVSAIGLATIDNLVGGLFNRFFRDGSTYRSGFEINVSTNMVNISTGVISFLFDEIPIIQNHSTSELHAHIHADGAFHQHFTIDDDDSYNDGTGVGNNKFFNAVFGIAITHNGAGVMYTVTQDLPSTEYTKAIDAEVDIEDTINFFPSNDIVSLAFIPVVRVVIRRSGGVNTIQTLSNGDLFDDLRGTVTKTSSSPPPSGITAHSDLTNLDFASAGHTGFASTLQLDNGSIIRSHNTSWITDNQEYWNGTDINALSVNASSGTITSLTVGEGANDPSIRFSSVGTDGQLIWEDDGDYFRTTSGGLVIPSFINTSDWSNVSITESQISDLNNYIINGTNVDFLIVNASKVTTDMLVSQDSQSNITYTPVSEGHLVLDGNGDYVTVQDATPINPLNGTVSMWIKYPDAPGAGFRYIMDISTRSGAIVDEIQFRNKLTSDIFTFRYRAGSTNYDADTTFSMNEGQNVWHLLTGTWLANNSLFIYLDGKLNGSGVRAKNFTDAPGNLNSSVIGSKRSNPEEWKGELDEARVWNKSLSPAEILADYVAGRNPVTSVGEENLIFWHPYNEDFSDSISGINGVGVGDAFVEIVSIDSWSVDKLTVREMIKVLDTVEVIGNLIADVITGDLDVIEDFTAGTIQADDGFDGACVDTQFVGGIATRCND